MYLCLCICVCFVSWRYCFIPDHPNKRSHTIFGGFPSPYRSYVYTTLWSIKCPIALSKKECRYLN